MINNENFKMIYLVYILINFNNLKIMKKELSVIKDFILELESSKLNGEQQSLLLSGGNGIEARATTNKCCDYTSNGACTNTVSCKNSDNVNCSNTGNCTGANNKCNVNETNCVNATNCTKAGKLMDLMGFPGFDI